MKRILTIILTLCLCLSMAVPVSAATEKSTASADHLYELGLMNGTGTDADGKPVYSLDRTMTRQEAITLVLSLLGKKEEAQKSSCTMPFTDVDEWAKPYVSYAYANGITSGTGPTTFGARSNITAVQYITFILKTLGYDATTDFKWNESYILSDKLGITHGEYSGNKVFLRGDAVVISDNALSVPMKNGGGTTLYGSIFGHEPEAEPEPQVKPQPQPELPALPSAVLNTTYKFSFRNVPAYSGAAFTVLNNNVPVFSQSDVSNTSYEKYSPLDSLGRCGAAIANVGKDLMPTEERGEIGMVKPSGWHTVRYDDLIEDRYMYNRCHLIAFQLTGENANEKNLITGTRYMNTIGMIDLENKVGNYVRSTGNHVLYRSTPVFDGNNLLASGVHLEALSVEDGGKGVMFNVFVYNVQPGVIIDYASGDSWRAEPQESSGGTKTGESTVPQQTEHTYILNTRTQKFHYPDCSSVSEMSEINKMVYTGDRSDIIRQGYIPCKRCNP